MKNICVSQRRGCTGFLFFKFSEFCLLTPEFILYASPKPLTMVRSVDRCDFGQPNSAMSGSA